MIRSSRQSTGESLQESMAPGALPYVIGVPFPTVLCFMLMRRNNLRDRDVLKASVDAGCAGFASIPLFFVFITSAGPAEDPKEFS